MIRLLNNYRLSRIVVLSTNSVSELGQAKACWLTCDTMGPVPSNTRWSHCQGLCWHTLSTSTRLWCSIRHADWYASVQQSMITMWSSAQDDHIVKNFDNFSPFFSWSIVAGVTWKLCSIFLEIVEACLLDNMWHLSWFRHVWNYVHHLLIWKMHYKFEIFFYINPSSIARHKTRQSGLFLCQYMQYITSFYDILVAHFSIPFQTDLYAGLVTTILH